MMDAGNPANQDEHKLAIERFDDDALTYLRFSGPIDEHFDGKKLAATVKTGTLVLHLADVNRMSSFGIREWGDFMEGVSKHVGKLVLIECSPKVMDQLNMVANFVGQGQVFSFYAPYRCDYCDSDDRVLFQVDRDWDLIKSMKPPEVPCSTCGELEHFDEDPITYFSYMANQGPFELDSEVRVLLASASKLDHAVSEVNQRLHVDKVVEGRFTYLKLSGDLDATFPRVKLAEGLEGTIILDMTEMGKLDPAGAAQWRTFLQMLTPAADTIYLSGMPPLFLEKLGTVGDLGAKTQLLSFAMLYSCTRCGVTAPYTVDVEAHHGLLKFASTPEMKCRDCKAPAQSVATKEMLYQLSMLPQPVVDPRVRSFIESVKKRPARSSTRSDAGHRAGGRSFSLAAVMVAVVALIAGGGLGYWYFQMRGPAVVSPSGVGALLGASAEARPSWITSDTPLAAECKSDDSMKMSCMGVSTFAGSEEQAIQEARDSALDAVVRSLGLLIDDVDWANHVGATYRRVRQAKVAAFFDEWLRAPGSMEHKRAEEALVQSRKAVSRALGRTAGEVIDIDTPSAVYKERYAAAPGPGERHLVFTRFQVSADDVRKLINLYSKPDDAMGATVLTAYPGLAWRNPDVEAGAMILDVGHGYLKDAGALKGQVITAIQGRMIKDAASFARIANDQLDKLETSGGTLRITVKTESGEDAELTVAISAE